jgi:hypothetical protein
MGKTYFSVTYLLSLPLESFWLSTCMPSFTV